MCVYGCTRCVSEYRRDSFLAVFDLLLLHTGTFVIQQKYLVIFVLPSKLNISALHTIASSLPQLVLAESAHSDGGSQCTESHPELPPPLERTGGIGDSRPPSFQ